MPARLATFAAAIVTAAVIVAVALVWGHPAPRAPAPAPTPTAIPDDGSWAAAAAALPLTTAAVVDPPYERESFGESGTDADPDGNGCSQRDDVLARDLADMVREGCIVLSGTLDDPYSGRTIAFARDGAATPASDRRHPPRPRRRPARRLRGGRVAVESRASRRVRRQPREHPRRRPDLARERNGRGPSRWMPAADHPRCEYAIRYTWIATAWELAVPRADRDVLVATLTECEH